MNDTDARKLATQVAKQSNGVSVKFGKTNGRSVLHLINKAARQSVTLFHSWEWDEHAWNRSNKPGPEATAA